MNTRIGLIAMSLFILGSTLITQESLSDQVTTYYFQTVNLSRDGNIRIEVTPESQQKRDGKVVVGVRFDIVKDNVLDPVFTVGTVGSGENMDTAFRTALAEWMFFFGDPFKNYTNKIDAKQFNDYDLFFSGKKAQGEQSDRLSTFIIPDEQWNAQLTRLIQDDQLFKKGAVNTSMILVIVQNGKFVGECRINGVVSTSFLNSIEKSGLFITLDSITSLLVKQYIIIAPRRN